MTALGFALLLIGAILVVAEAHVPGTVLGVSGAAALVAGAVILIAALGGSAALAVPVGVGLGAAAGGWTVLVGRQAAGSRDTRIQAGVRGVVRPHWGGAPLERVRRAGVRRGCAVARAERMDRHRRGAASRGRFRGR